MLSRTMKLISISNPVHLATRYVKAANSMTLPSSQKQTRETFLLYGAWTILILSMLAMVLPASNSQSFSDSPYTETIEAINTDVNPR